MMTLRKKPWDSIDMMSTRMTNATKDLKDTYNVYFKIYYEDPEGDWNAYRIGEIYQSGELIYRAIYIGAFHLVIAQILTEEVCERLKLNFEDVWRLPLK